MGAGASIVEKLESAGVSDDCRKFIDIFMPLCYKKKESKLLRKGAWRSVDNNGNGYVSLAETGKWIKTALLLHMMDEAKPGDRGKGSKKTKAHLGKCQVQEVKDSALLLYKRFYPCYIRGFLDAADIGKNGKVGGTKTATKDDYVQRGEFRFLCIYLCIYSLMYDAFDLVDGGSAGATKDDDRRISRDELGGVVGKFAGHPLAGLKQLGMTASYGQVDKVFGEMDADGKGKVLLKEWCEWLECEEVQHCTLIGKLLTKAEEDTFQKIDTSEAK